MRLLDKENKEARSGTRRSSTVSPEQRMLIASTINSAEEQSLQFRGVQTGPTVDVARRLLRALMHRAGLIENARKRTTVAAANDGVPPRRWPSGRTCPPRSSGTCRPPAGRRTAAQRRAPGGRVGCQLIRHSFTAEIPRYVLAGAGWPARVTSTGAARSRAGRPAVDQDSGSEAVFLDPVRQAVQQRWPDAAHDDGVRGPAAGVGVPRAAGRRRGPGLWWPATTGRHVAAGSNTMRVQLKVLDRDRHVTGPAGQPGRLLWRDPRGQMRSWMPQLFPRYADGTTLRADCPSHPDTGGQRALHTAQAATEACAHIGRTYRRPAPLDDALAPNPK